MSVQSRHRAAPQQQAGGCRPPEDTTACASAAFSSLQYVVPAPEARKPTSFSSPTCAYFHLTRRDLALASPGVRAGCPHHRTEPPNPSRKASFDTGFPPSVLSGWRSTQSSRVLGTGTLSRDTTSPPMPRQPCPGFSQSPSPETSLSRGKNSSKCARRVCESNYQWHLRELQGPRAGRAPPRGATSPQREAHSHQRGSAKTCSLQATASRIWERERGAKQPRGSEAGAHQT